MELCSKKVFKIIYNPKITQQGPKRPKWTKIEYQMIVLYFKTKVEKVYMNRSQESFGI